MDPDKDVEITVADGTLRIRAKRREEHKEPHHSEFRYGSFTRSVALPERADTEHVTASYDKGALEYDKGVLEVSVPVPEAKPKGRRIEITKASRLRRASQPPDRRAVRSGRWRRPGPFEGPAAPFLMPASRQAGRSALCGACRDDAWQGRWAGAG